MQAFGGAAAVLGRKEARFYPRSMKPAIGIALLIRSFLPTVLADGPGTWNASHWMSILSICYIRFRLTRWTF